VNSLVSASNIGVPQIRLGVEKHWWTPELSDLKQQCIELTDIWRQHGCPRSGPINENRVKVKLRYKSAIKDAIISADEEFNEDLADHLCKKDFNSFWKSWRKRFCSQKIKPTRVLNKRTGDMNILDEFTTYYTKVGQTNSVGADDKFKSFVTSFIQAETNINSHSNALMVDVHVVQEKK